MKEIIICLIICTTLVNLSGGMSRKESLAFVSKVASVTQETIQTRFNEYEKQRNEALVNKDPAKEQIAFEAFKKSLSKVADDIKAVENKSK
jgi:hypothetical protein